MHNEFQKLGIPVSITRNTDTTLSSSERTKKYYLFFGNKLNVIVIYNYINAGEG